MPEVHDGPQNQKRSDVRVVDRDGMAVLRPRIRPDADRLGAAVEKVAGGRETEVLPVVSGPGVAEIHNDMTGPILLPGNDGEPMGLDELVPAIVLGAPQVVKNKTPPAVRTRVFGPWVKEAKDPYQLIPLPMRKVMEEVQSPTYVRPTISNNRPPFRRKGYRYPGVM